MITVSEKQNYGANRFVLNMVGLSSDALPHISDEVDGCTLTNGSILLLMDTGVVKVYSEGNDTWYDL